MPATSQDPSAVPRDYLTLRVDGPPAAEADPATQAAVFRLMVENAVEVVVRYDAAHRRVYVSPSAREVLGYAPAEMLGGRAYGLNHTDDIERAVDTLRRIGPARPCDKLVFRVRRKDGAYIWLETLYRYLPEDGGVLSAARDVTARKRAEEALAETNAKLEAANRRLAALAQQDGLTGLSNRRRFDEVLDGEFARARRDGLPLAVVMVDVDCFKAYNDTYGHVAGDECLRRIGGAVMGALRRPADLAARYGGEEMAVLLPATGEGAAVHVAERIRETVVALGIGHLGSPSGLATVSAGVCSMVPPAGGGPARLVGAADRALYRAKAEGRNRVCSDAPATSPLPAAP